MRGPTPKVLTDMKDVNKVDMEVPSADLQPRLGQELLYNVNLMVNMVEVLQLLVIINTRTILM